MGDLKFEGLTIAAFIAVASIVIAVVWFYSTHDCAHYHVESEMVCREDQFSMTRTTRCTNVENRVCDSWVER
jgi:hypothetical protein